VVLRRRLLPVAVCLAAVTGCGQAAHTADAPPVTTPLPTRPPDPLVRASVTGAQAARRLARQGRPLYCGGQKPYVALTFDDGPGPRTLHALRILRHFHVPATFFVIGRNLEVFPGRVRKQAAAGVVGDHTWSHPNLNMLRLRSVAHQIDSTRTAIRRRTLTTVALFRPPYEDHDKTVDAAVRRRDMLTVLWNVDSQDSEGGDYRSIARRVRAGLRPGSIIVMHENKLATLRALRHVILPRARHLHLTLVTIPQLLALNPPSAHQLRRGYAGCLIRHGSRFHRPDATIAPAAR
jgi:peptidoglycan/xylan/chitin deacetylase (PgdA/CDA1 family)